MIVAASVAHPDDEIIGIGGTLYKHIQNGDKVFVYIVCDGRKRSNLAHLRRKENVEAISINESVEALSCIGIYRAHIEFFN